MNASNGGDAGEWGAYNPWGQAADPVKDPKALWDYYRWNGGWGYLNFSALGMYYVHGRWYRPDIGQFITPDGKGEYTYNPNQDPVNQALSAGSSCYSGESQYLPIVPSLSSVPAVSPASLNELKALPYKSLIKKECATYGVPWQVVAGVLETEIQLDTDWGDWAEDLWAHVYPPYAEGKDYGPGVGNIHIRTLRATDKYLIEQYAKCDEFQLGIQPNAPNTTLAFKLFEDAFTIKALTAHVRSLADYRFGSGGQPLIASHANLSSWALTDAVAIWHAYRFGIKDLPLTSGGDGFDSIQDFQDRTPFYMDLERFIQFKVGRGAEKSARGSIKYFLAYWYMAE